MAAVEGRREQQTICFGEFELDLASQTLSQAGARAKLQPQPFQVLKLLVECAPAVVSREEIRRHVWGDAVHVDAGQSINFCIRQIRVALGDTSAGPRFIETLPRQGYRFIAPLQGDPGNTVLPDSLPVPGPTSRLPKRLNWFILELAVSVFLTIVAAWIWFLPRNAPSAVVRITPVTTYLGDEREPSISPDGRQVAFSWGGEGGGNRDIFLTVLGEQHPVRLTTDPAEDAYPSWSPDGKQIAFIRRRGGTRADIMTVPAMGGQERKLREIRLGQWLSSHILAWSPDGKWLCFTNEVGASGHHALFLLSPGSPAVRRLLPEEENGIGDSSPAFSPDGRWLAFARYAHVNNSSLLIQRLSPDLLPEGAPIVVKDAGVKPTSPVWMPNGRKILFLDQQRIMEADVGRRANPFYVSPSTFSELTLAGRSGKLLACVQNQRDEIWAITLSNSGLKAADGDALPMLQSSAGESHPRFSPDGHSLAFISMRSGSAEVWVADADGQNPRQLTQSSFYRAGYPNWSPDGHSLVFHGRLPQEPELYVVGVANAVVQQITHRRPGFMGPSWSRDGESFYADSLENGKNRTYRVPVAGGPPQLLFEGSAAVEVPGQDLLLYNKQDQSGIYGRSLAGDFEENPEHLLAVDYQAPWGGFYPVSDGFYYTGCNSTGVPRAFRFHSFVSGKSWDVAPAPSNLSLGLSVNPDRTRLAYSTKSQGSEDLVQIEFK